MAHRPPGAPCQDAADDTRDPRPGAFDAGMPRRRFVARTAAFLGFSGAMASRPGLAQSAGASYPNHFVRMVVPYPPGGSVDPVARILSMKLSELWGQRLVIDNRPGASTIIGTDAVAKAQPDGYTLLLTASTHVTNALLFPDLPYDYVRDFAPVGTVYKAEFILVSHPSVPATTLQELIAYLRANPGKVSYASAGAGNASHIAGEVFSRMTGVEMVHVPYRGGGPLTTDLLRGDIQLYFAVPVAVIPPIRSGALRAYATTADSRLSVLPEVPTFAEAGLPGFGIRSWIGIWAPAGTPADVVAKLNADLARVLSMADVRERLESQGQVPFISTPEALAQLQRDDAESFGRAIRDANIQLER